MKKDETSLFSVCFSFISDFALQNKIKLHSDASCCHSSVKAFSTRNGLFCRTEACSYRRFTAEIYWCLKLFEKSLEGLFYGTG